MVQEKVIKELNDQLKRRGGANEDNTTYRLPKEKHALLIEVMKSSQQYCYVVFDKNGILADAMPDVPGI